MSIRLLIADSWELAVHGVQAIMAGQPRVQVVGVARNKEELHALLPELRPDVVLIDHISEGFGAEAIRDGLKLWKRARYVAITPDPSPVALMNAIRSGVTSYIKKDCGADEILDAVLQTADGDKFFCGKILEAMERASVDMEQITTGPMTCTPVTLTEREYEIIALIAEGLSYTRIAERLFLSAHTVTTHRRNIMQKLGVNNTAAMVMYAVKHELVSPNRYLFSAGA